MHCCFLKTFIVLNLILIVLINNSLKKRIQASGMQTGLLDEKMIMLILIILFLLNNIFDLK